MPPARAGFEEEAYGRSDGDMTIINCDMGESFGLYRAGDDAGLMPLISAANVACGFHASDFNHMRATVRLATGPPQ